VQKWNSILFTNLSVCSTNPTRSLLIRSINWPLAIENKDVNMSNVQHDVKKVATLPSHIENVYERGITCVDENQQKS
jgi:hypothetical protein